MQKGTMLKALALAEARLTDLLRNPGDWHSLDVDYEPPRVERLWRFLEDGTRLYLHRIHPCETALFHPHPWPSAIKVLSGAYEMGVGSSSTSEEPDEAATILLTAGSSYEMIDPNGCHYVRPIGAPSLSLMLTGAPWVSKHPGLKGPKGKQLEPLDPSSSYALLKDVRGVLARAREAALRAALLASKDTMDGRVIATSRIHGVDESGRETPVDVDLSPEEIQEYAAISMGYE